MATPDLTDATEREKRMRTWWRCEFLSQSAQVRKRRAKEDLPWLARDMALTIEDEAVLQRAVEALWKVWEGVEAK